MPDLDAFDFDDYDSADVIMYNDDQLEVSPWERLEMLKACSFDVAWQTALSVRFLVAVAVLCHFTAICCKRTLATLFVHITSGLVALFVHYDYDYLSILTIAGESLGFYIIHKFSRSSKLSLLLVLCCTCIPEFTWVDSVTWHSIRGCHIILAMKLISLLENADYDFITFMSYCLSPATLIYGPWISYSAFLISMDFASMNLSVFIHICTNLVYGLVCLIGSTCILGGILFDDTNLPRELTAARDSYSFILSHCFVSYLSTVIATSAGVRSISQDIVSNSHLVVTKPFDILVPRSLTQLVIAWSLPMHAWLRKYVFKPIKALYGPLAGILATYSASALLHGFNGQIAIVLLSIGVFTFVEFNFRSRMSKIFDACVSSKSCEDCGKECLHQYNLDHSVVRSINVAFSFYTVLLFAYATSCFGVDSDAGAQVDGYSLLHLLKTWSNLGWFGHLACLVTFVFDYATK